VEEEDGATLKQWLEGIQPEEDADDAKENASHQAGAALAHEDSVFLQSYIPRTLNEVYDPERDVDALKKGRGKTLIYADTIGLVQPLTNSGDSNAKVRFSDGEISNEGSSNSSESEGDQESVEHEEDGDTDEKKGFQERTPRGHRHEDREMKKERKKAVKADAREKRKHKIPKADKKRKIKNTRS